MISGDVSINLALCVNKENISIKSTLPKFKDIDEIKKDAIIIHRTYLDNKITGKTPKEFIKLLMKTFGTVIVTSGGGYPHNLDTEVKFVPFSLVEKPLIAGYQN
ncbi:MAG: hypothetical protein IPG78_03480 [Ignavibacteria bacterium]|nr:hypothetical protein [Ignavibacteria bacterium]